MAKDAKLSTCSSGFVDQCQQVMQTKCSLSHVPKLWLDVMNEKKTEKKKDSEWRPRGCMADGVQSRSMRPRLKVQNQSAIWGPLESRFYGKFHLLSVAKLWWVTQVAHILSRKFPKYLRRFQCSRGSDARKESFPSHPKNSLQSKLLWGWANIITHHQKPALGSVCTVSDLKRQMMRLTAKFASVHLYYLCKHLLIHYLPATKKEKKRNSSAVFQFRRRNFIYIANFLSKTTQCPSWDEYKIMKF